MILGKQKNALERIHRLDGKLGEHLKRVDFLVGIKQRTSIPGGSCDFDLPQLRFWLNQTHEQRLADLQKWVAPYIELETVIDLILKAIRDSAVSRPVVAEKGFYQQSLDPQQSNQMIRIGVDSDQAIYPEISAGKHRYSVRFMKPQQGDSMPTQCKEDVSFLLSRCSL